MDNHPNRCGSRNGPWTGVSFHESSFYVVEGGELEDGRILRISPEGKSAVVVMLKLRPGDS